MGVHPCRIGNENLDPNNAFFSPLPCEKGSLISDPRFGGWCSDFHSWNDPLVFLSPGQVAMGSDYLESPECDSNLIGVCCLDAQADSCIGGCQDADAMGCCCYQQEGVFTKQDVTESFCLSKNGSFLEGRVCQPFYDPDDDNCVDLEGNATGDCDPACLLPGADYGGNGFCDTTDPRCICSTETWVSGPGDVDCSVGACCSADSHCASYGGHWNVVGTGKGVCCLKWQCTQDWSVGNGACCTQGECTVKTKNACASQLGNWYGSNTTCPGEDDGRIEIDCETITDPNGLIVNELYNTCINDISDEECACIVEEYKQAFNAPLCNAEHHPSSASGGFMCCEEGDCCYRGPNGCPDWVDCEGFGDGQSDATTCCCITSWSGLAGNGGVTDPFACGDRLNVEDGDSSCATTLVSECSGSDYDASLNGGTCTSRSPVESCSNCNDGDADGSCDNDSGGFSNNIPSKCCDTVAEGECPDDAYWQGPGTTCVDTDGIPNEGCGVKTCRTPVGCTRTSANMCLDLWEQNDQGAYYDPVAVGFWESGFPSPCKPTDNSLGVLNNCNSSTPARCCKNLTESECKADPDYHQWLAEGECNFSVGGGTQADGWCGTCTECPPISTD